LLTVQWLCSRIEQVRPRSLFIIGTADRFYQPEILKHLEDVAQGHSVVIQGANHGLEVPGSIPQSLNALHQIVGAIQEFLIEAASRV
jgi:predicted deacylase